MKRIWLGIVCVFFLHANATGQRGLVDSLHYLLEKAPDVYAEIDALLGLSRIHMLGEPPISMGLDHAQRALELAIEIDDQSEEVMARMFVAMCKRNLAINYEGELQIAKKMAIESGDPNAIAFSSGIWVEEQSDAYQKGMDELESIITIYRDQLTKKNYGNILKVLAEQYELVGRHVDAEQTYHKAIEVFRTISEDPDIIPNLGTPSAQVIDGGLANLIQTITYYGQLCAKLGRYQEAITSAKEAWQLSQEYSLSFEAWSGINLGEIYFDSGEFDKAIDLFITSIEVYKQIDEPFSMGTAIVELAEVYMTIQDYPQAEKRLHEALDILKDIPHNRAAVLSLLGDLYQETNRYENAEKVYLQADSLFELLDHSLQRVHCQLGIAYAESQGGYYELAIQRIENLLPRLIQINDNDLLYKSYRRLALIHQENAQHPQALSYAKQALSIAQHDSLNYIKLKEIHLELSALEEVSDNLSIALYHHKMYRYYDDRLYIESAHEALMAEQLRQNVLAYKEDKEQAEQIAQLLSQQNKVYLIVAGLLSFLLSIGSYLFFQLRKTRIQLANQNIVLQDLNHTKDRFFGIIAHDLRSPIVALDSVDEQMSYYAKQGKLDKLERLSKMVTTTAKNLNTLLDNLLSWALLQTGSIPYKPQQLGLIAIVSEIIDLFNHSASVKEITIENKISPQALVYADERAVQTILRNLLSNAIKFCAAGDTVTVAEDYAEDNRIITITDSGCGMKVQQLEQIFSIDKKHYKGTAGEKGTGLGLILVKDLIELNKGVLSIQSQAGIGTMVSFTLPVGDQR